MDLYLRQASDFIQRCKMEQVLQLSEEALRDADRRKDEFLALLAHELRNPLAPIRYALAGNKKAGRTPEQQARAEEIIERQVTHMSRLLDDLLDISRITRGKLELKKSLTELTLAVGTAIETARPILDAKRHILSLDLPKAAVRLEADPVRLAQAFSNLLINAAKYTDPGGHIQLRAAQEGGEVVVTIRDNGIGISKDMMPRLFTLFSQAQTALGRAEGGLGIGLSLVRGVVTLHGGSIEARSDGPGAGSEFIVRLPIGTPLADLPNIEATTGSLVSEAGLKILVVDDNQDAADACASLLELSGHHVQAAYTGRGALDLAETFRPHALLLDIGLPDFNGYELATKIRATPWGRGVILIAVTGWGQEEDRRRALEAGFNHHLTKPIAPATVESLLQSLDPALRAAQ
ncbi:MAG TPA: ATP-binding protein [Steroidobacteraceae bacterium]|nr:ATP-binding protein [Steroidobacteraceae bacterium]